MPVPSSSGLGPYEIQSVLGSGGMGEVYRAPDTGLYRDVTLKVLPDPLQVMSDSSSCITNARGLGLAESPQHRRH
jgi:serine/threonine protein kinase